MDHPGESGLTGLSLLRCAAGLDLGRPHWERIWDVAVFCSVRW